jgi:DNA mismatch repair ATPase MutS
MIENDEENPTKETLVFLYKFVEGSCPKSHGFNAARTSKIARLKEGNLLSNLFFLIRFG